MTQNTALNPTPWVCDVCHKTIDDGSGFIEVFNTNPTLGDVGGSPMQATPDDRDDPSEDDFKEMSGANLAQLLTRKANIGFRAFHKKCGGPETFAYNFPLPPDLERYIGWVLQLEEKLWMGRRDVTRMLYYWWENRGLPRPQAY